VHDTVESPVEASAADYATLVGQRLRRIRRQKGLSLQDVEALSGQEFKASVVGAYERGERIISVPRLQRLAALYRVPVDQLLPSEGVESPFGGADETDEALRARAGRALEAGGGATTDAILGALTSVEGIREQDVRIVEDPVASPGLLKISIASQLDDARSALAASASQAA
jgi:transcriptional regulator with XRE-family HTH domain